MRCLTTTTSFSVSGGLLLAAAVAAQAQKETSAFQVQQPWGLRQKLEGPDDYMKDMHGEMMRHNTNYDLSFNNSPNSMGFANEILQAMGSTNSDRNKNPPATTVDSPILLQAHELVAPWPTDDGMRDTASEWDLLGNNYDYSFNRSPTDNRCQETEQRRKLQQQQLQEAQMAAKKNAEVLVPNVKSWDRDGWERWMSLSKVGPDRGEKTLGVDPPTPAGTSTLTSPSRTPVPASTTRSYLDSL